MIRRIVPAAVLGLAALAPVPCASAELPPTGLAPSLHRDPFERPEIRPPPAPARPVVRAEPARAPPWRPVLRGTVVAGDGSLANLDGAVVPLGAEVNGHRLVEVRERAVVLDAGDGTMVIRMDPESGAPGS